MAAEVNSFCFSDVRRPLTSSKICNYKDVQKINLRWLQHVVFTQLAAITGSQQEWTENPNYHALSRWSDTTVNKAPVPSKLFRRGNVTRYISLWKQLNLLKVLLLHDCWKSPEPCTSLRLVTRVRTDPHTLSKIKFFKYLLHYRTTWSKKENTRSKWQNAIGQEAELKPGASPWPSPSPVHSKQKMAGNSQKNLKSRPTAHTWFYQSSIPNRITP